MGLRSIISARRLESALATVLDPSEGASMSATRISIEPAAKIRTLSRPDVADSGR
jgi:hypothetical protein